jgi:signal transduction histidine kinase
MELNKTKNGFYILISFSVLMLLLLGGWWLYLVMKLASKLKDLNHPSIEGNLVSMIQWEGVTFFIFLIILTITLLYIYLSDHRKTRSLQVFFSSLTHELKTPLASIKLQSQVLLDHIGESSLPKSEKDFLNKYTTRLANDSIRLEDQLDKHLQLSRIERGAFLNLRSINIYNFIQNEIKRYKDFASFSVEIDDKTSLIKADDFALQTIIRNLIENSIKHSNIDNINCRFNSVTEGNIIKLFYTDNNKSFSGDTTKLGELFYKYNSPQGSGLGLYIIKKFMYLMGGKPHISVNESIVLELHFKRGNTINE